MAYSFSGASLFVARVFYHKRPDFSRLFSKIYHLISEQTDYLFLCGFLCFGVEVDIDMVDRVADSTAHGGGALGHWCDWVFLQRTILSVLNFGLKKHRQSAVLCIRFHSFEKTVLILKENLGGISELMGHGNFVPHI